MDISDTNKIKKNKKEYIAKKFQVEKRTKEAINILSNLRTNIYQRVYYLVSSNVETWRQFDFLSSDTKIDNFIEKLEREIKLVRTKTFNFDKYRTAILYIVGKGASKFNEPIIKNMYIAKLQNIIFILKKAEDGDEIKEVKDNSITR